VTFAVCLIRRGPQRPLESFDKVKVYQHTIESCQVKQIRTRLPSVRCNPSNSYQRGTENPFPSSDCKLRPLPRRYLDFLELVFRRSAHTNLHPCRVVFQNLGIRCS